MGTPKKIDWNMLFGASAVGIAVLVLLWGDDWLGRHPATGNSSGVDEASPTANAVTPDTMPTKAAQISGRQRHHGGSIASPSLVSGGTSSDPSPKPSATPANGATPDVSAPQKKEVATTVDEPLEYQIGKIRFGTWSPRVVSTSPSRVRVRFNIAEPSSVEDKTPIDFKFDDELSQWELQTESATCRGDPSSIDRGTAKRRISHSYQLIPGGDYDLYVEYTCSRLPASGESVVASVTLNVTGGSTVSRQKVDGLVLFSPRVPPVR